MNTILIIDDNESFLKDLELLLSPYYRILTAANATKGMQILKSQQVSAVLLDLQLPDISGLDLIEVIHNEIDNFLPIIIITEHNDTQYVVKAMRLGAQDFLSKDFNIEIMREKISQAMAQKEMRVQLTGMQNTNLLTDDKFIFASDAMKKINFEISRIAKFDYDVLLSGETGVGKDMAAMQIYLRSKRRDKPFIPIPISTLSETIMESELFGHEKGSFTGADKVRIGKFEAANQGTLYLPEISNLPENIQLKLLHFMQYKSISRVGSDSRKREISLDVKIIMATNDNLENLVKEGRIRKDFYYRITGVNLTIPPLRERKKDIRVLANYFLEKYTENFIGEKYEFEENVIEEMEKYNWRGNVRELSNSIKNAIIYCSNNRIKICDFPNITRGYSTKGIETKPEFYGDGHMEYKEFEKRMKREYFTKLLDETEGKISAAALKAGLTPQGLRKILKQIEFDNKL